MEYSNGDSTNMPATPQSYMQRNKLLAAILIPLSLILIFITAASILGQLFAAPKAIADEVPLGARILVDSVGCIGAVAGLTAALLALTNSLNVNKFLAAGDQDAAINASEKARKYGANLPLLIGMFALLLAVKIAQAFFLGK